MTKKYILYTLPGMKNRSPADIIVHRFDPGPVSIPLIPLLRTQGYKDPNTVREDVRRVAAWAAERVGRLAAPVAIYRRMPIKSRTEDRLDLAGGRTFHSGQFVSTLVECREVVTFALTLGPAVDDESIRSMEQDEIVEALFLEYAGWIAIEQATRSLAAHLQSELTESGLRLTRRLAPGYFDWPLEEQRDFLSLFPVEGLPVRVLESCAILPKKSRTGLYGLQPISSGMCRSIDLVQSEPMDSQQVAI